MLNLHLSSLFQVSVVIPDSRRVRLLTLEQLGGRPENR